MVEILAYKAGVFGGFFCFLIDDRAITFNARSSSETDAETRFQLVLAELPTSVLCTWR